MRKLTVILLLFFFVPSAFAQDLTSQWEGHIAVQGQKLIIKTHFMGDDSLRGTIDIPQQGASGLVLQNIRSTENDSVFFAFIAGPGNIAKFKGTFASDSAITGSFHQNGLQFPFELKRTEVKKDTDHAPLPYTQEDLIIQNDSIAIAGTLTRPKDGQASRLVIMISGSGAQNRDEEILGFKPFARIADHLTRNGMATFRFDDRSIGKSTGNFSDATLDILASDVEAIIAYLSNRKDHNFSQIILLGHSQGGVVAGKVAAENESIDKIILMASTGVPLKEVLRSQVKQAFAGAPIDSQLVNEEIAAREQLMEAIRDGKQIQQAQEHYQEQFAAIQVAAGADSAQAISIAQSQAQQLRSAFSTPQMQSLLFYNPANDLRELNIPVLALFGGKDTQVTVEMNKEPIKKALESVGVPFQIKVFENANHLFQKAKTGQVQEYATLDKKFVDDFTSTITEWIKK